MSKIPMISNAKHTYDGKTLMPNEPFEALNEDDADELKCIGFATRAKAPTAAAVARPAATYQTRVLVADKPVVTQVQKPARAEPKAQSKPKRLRTRDMGSSR